MVTKHGLQLHRLRRWLLLSGALLMVAIGFWALSWAVQAAGSGTLYPAGTTGFRANIEWRNSFYGDNFLRRRTLLKVYAEQGEIILSGSSAVGVDSGDILIYNPGRVTGRIGDEVIPATPNFSCQAQREASQNPAQGQITSRAQELAGPDTITDTALALPGLAIPNAYVPCFYVAPESGIYNVVIVGPRGIDSDEETPPTGELDLTSLENFDSNQDTSVSAWDVTVRDSLTTTQNVSGRLFANYLTMFTGSNPRPMNGTLYVLTTDGYIYQTELRGLDPNGFMVYANDVGFLDSDGTPLYHNVVADPGGTLQEQNQLNDPQGGVILSPPTHLIFFEQPDNAAILANDIPLDPPLPAVTALAFQGDLGGNNASVRGGGTFFYTTNVAGTFELIISRDGSNFDPTDPLNRVLRRIAPAGDQSIAWDGLDNAGNPFPAGLDYPVRITVRAGEYHFPLLDIENSAGGPQYTLINPPGDDCPSFGGNPPNCNVAFYDDRGYVTAQGTAVGTPGQVLPGIDPPPLARSDPLQGFDTTTDQRRFGDDTGNGFGDKKGLDLWTYYPSDPAFTTLNIFALNLSIDKTDNNLVTTPGGTIAYTLTYTNAGPSDASGVVITETVPADTTFNAAASFPSVWDCPDGSSAGSLCTLSVGDLVVGAVESARFAVTVSAVLPPGVETITNTVLIREDGSKGTEDLTDNVDTEITPIGRPAPLIIKAADRETAQIGDLVTFGITVYNPGPPATAAATNLSIVDRLPVELDFVSLAVVSDPPDLAHTPLVTTEIVSTIGHPSGISQTAASTVTVNIPVLDVNQTLSLILTTRVNELASPAPLTIANVAVLVVGISPPVEAPPVIILIPGPPAPAQPPENPKRPGEPVPEEPREDTPVSIPVPEEPRKDVPVSVPLPVQFLPETGTRSPQWKIGINTSDSLLMLVVAGGLILWKRVRSGRKRCRGLRTGLAGLPAVDEGAMRGDILQERAPE